MNRRGSEGVRRRLIEAGLAVYFALAPSTVPEWRMSIAVPPAAVLLVGEPIRMLGRSSRGEQKARERD